MALNMSNQKESLSNRSFNDYKSLSFSRAIVKEVIIKKSNVWLLQVIVIEITVIADQ